MGLTCSTGMSANSGTMVGRVAQRETPNTSAVTATPTAMIAAWRGPPTRAKRGARNDSFIARYDCMLMTLR